MFPSIRKPPDGCVVDTATNALVEAPWQTIVEWSLWISITCDTRVRNDLWHKTLHALIFGYRLVCTADELLQLLIELHTKPFGSGMFGGGGGEFTAEHFRLRILQFFRAWMKLATADFQGHPERFDTLLEFLDGVVSICEVNKMKLRFVRHAVAKRENFDFFKTPTGAWPSWFNARMLDLEPIVILEALTYIDMSLFRRLKAEDVINGEKSALLMSQRFNQVSFGVTSSILCAATIEEQVQLVEKYVEVAGLAYDASSFNTMAGIISGLSSHDVQRLREIEARLSPRHSATRAQLERLLAGDSNFFALRHMEKTRDNVLPFVWLHARDVVVFKESMLSDVKVGSSAAVSVRDLLSIGETLQSLFELQQSHSAARLDTPQAGVMELMIRWPFLPKDEAEKRSDVWKQKFQQSLKLQLPRTDSALHGRSLLHDRGRTIDWAPCSTPRLTTPRPRLVSQRSLLRMTPRGGLQDVKMSSLVSCTRQPAAPVDQVSPRDASLEAMLLTLLDETTSEDSSPRDAGSSPRQRALLGQFTQCASHGAFRAARGRRRAALKQLSVLSAYYRKRVRGPHVQVTPESRELATAGVLYFDQQTMKSIKGEPILFMNPQRFFPRRHGTQAILDLLMGYGEIMCATSEAQEHGYTFVADLTSWTMQNFSIKYASSWFGMQQMIPLKINRFIVLNAPPFFPAIFRVIKGFMSRQFKKKWEFTDYKGLLSMFPADSLPSSVGGTLKISAMRYCLTFLNAPRVSHFRMWDGEPLQQHHRQQIASPRASTVRPSADNSESDSASDSSSPEPSWVVF